MLRDLTLLVLVAVLLPVGLTANAHAQMFGQRANRPSLSERLRSTQRTRRGTGPEAQQEVGQVVGDERFVRGNRTAADFVGADTLDRPAFVGEQSAEMLGRIRTAVEDLRPTRERDLNERLRTPRTNQMYHPRLRVNFAFAPPTSQEVRARIATQLQVTETLNLPEPIEVLVDDGTATLRGVVASARDREMAALLIRFEPGISRVRNELQVRPPAKPRKTAGPGPVRAEGQPPLLPPKPRAY